MSYISKSAVAVIGLFTMALVASRQLFLFTAFRDPEGFLDSKAGRYHLVLAIIAAVLASLAGTLMFYFFRRQDGNEWSQPLTVPGESATRNYSTNVTSHSPAMFDATRWARLNPWLSEGQANDRTQMRGTDGVSSGSLAARRSSARRNHQVMYKKWSQARHD